VILVDTNVWIAHLDRGEPELSRMLLHRNALIHPYTIGEIALGSLTRHKAVPEELTLLPGIAVASHDEVMRMISTRGISGVGYVDAHLLASALLVPNVRLWTRDKRLQKVAAHLNLLAPLA
jgi:predicted nucleic acid-binding protein